MNTPEQTHAEEIFLQKDREATDLSQNLQLGSLDMVAEVQARMDQYGGYTTAGLAIGAAGVSLDDMDTYHDVMHMQEHALDVNRLINLGKRWVVDPSLTARSTELQAKLANFPYDPRNPEADLPVDDDLVVETWELAEKVAAENRKTNS